MRYRIETKNDRGQWDAECLSADSTANDFASEAEAEDAIEELKKLDGWDSVQFRVIEQ